MDKPRIFLGSSATQNKLLQALTRGRRSRRMSLSKSAMSARGRSCELAGPRCGVDRVVISNLECDALLGKQIRVEVGC
jgi:hypothetical protein